MNLTAKRDPVRLSIQSRFMLYFGGVLLGIMCLVTLVAGSRQRESAINQIQKRGLVAAQSIASVSTQSLLIYDYPSLQRFADEIRVEIGAAYVVIHDKEGLVAGLSGRPDLQGQRLADEVSAEATRLDRVTVQSHQSIAGPLINPDGSSVLEVALPVHVAGSSARWGTVRVGLSLSEMRRELASTLRDLALLGIFSVLVVLLSARYLTGRITGPLRELAEAATLIAGGKLDHRVTERLVGELGDTARSFNKMTADLRRSRDAIRYQNQHLENMVQERTAALRQKARELEKANAELKEVDRMKSDFLSNVSHELRTPLTSIKSFTEILRDQDTVIGPAERTEFLDIIASQTDRLTRLIGDLLDLSKIEAGEFHCDLEPLPLSSMVVTPSLEPLRRVAEDQQIRLVAEVADDLPAVLGDADRLSQVLTNLVDNALKFTPAGGTVRVRATVEHSRVPSQLAPQGFYGLQSDTPETGRYVVLEVADDGIGIPTADLQRIFEKFGQVGNVLTAKPQGTGLGLAISGSIVVQLGGALWVTSEEGVGSRFYFSMPVSQQSEEGERADRGNSGSVDTGYLLQEIVDAVHESARGHRILVVNGGDGLGRRILQALEPQGYRAIGCEGGLQAASRARDIRPDAIVLDSILPDTSGYDVLRMLKAEPSLADTPIVLVGPASEQRMAYELGATRHVPKDGLQAGAVLAPSL